MGKLERGVVVAALTLASLAPVGGVRAENGDITQTGVTASYYACEEDQPYCTYAVTWRSETDSGANAGVYYFVYNRQTWAVIVTPTFLELGPANLTQRPGRVTVSIPGLQLTWDNDGQYIEEAMATQDSVHGAVVQKVTAKSDQKSARVTGVIGSVGIDTGAMPTLEGMVYSYSYQNRCGGC